MRRGPRRRRIKVGSERTKGPKRLRVRRLLCFPGVCVCHVSIVSDSKLLTTFSPAEWLVKVNFRNIKDNKKNNVLTVLVHRYG